MFSSPLPAQTNPETLGGYKVVDRHCLSFRKHNHFLAQKSEHTGIQAIFGRKTIAILPQSVSSNCNHHHHCKSWGCNSNTIGMAGIRRTISYLGPYHPCRCVGVGGGTGGEQSLAAAAFHQLSADHLQLSPLPQQERGKAVSDWVVLGVGEMQGAAHYHPLGRQRGSEASLQLPHQGAGRPVRPISHHISMAWKIALKFLALQSNSCP